jgi:hypothetical protein
MLGGVAGTGAVRPITDAGMQDCPESQQPLDVLGKATCHTSMTLMLSKYSDKTFQYQAQSFDTSTLTHAMSRISCFAQAGRAEIFSEHRPWVN